MNFIGLSCVALGLVLAGCNKLPSTPTSTADADANTALPATMPAPPPTTPDPGPPGVYYLLTSVRHETRDGIDRLLPGSEVKLIRDGLYHTQIGDMRLNSKDLTHDRTEARLAQRADAAAQVAAYRASRAMAATPYPTPNAAIVSAYTADPRAPDPGAVTVDATIRNKQFRLAALQKEEQDLQAKADYLWQAVHKMRPNSVSTAPSELEQVNIKIAKVESDIRQLQNELRPAGQ